MCLFRNNAANEKLEIFEYFEKTADVDIYHSNMYGYNILDYICNNLYLKYTSVMHTLKAHVVYIYTTDAINGNKKSIKLLKKIFGNYYDSMMDSLTKHTKNNKLFMKFPIFETIYYKYWHNKLNLELETFKLRPNEEYYLEALNEFNDDI